jgi:hypothetical protein
MAVAERDVLLIRAEEVEERLDEAKPKSAALETYETRMTLCLGVEDAILDLCNVLPQGTADFEAKLLLTFMVELRRAIIEDAGEGEDSHGQIELTRLRMLDVLKRMERRIQHSQLDVPDRAVTFLLDIFADLPTADLAELLGVTTKTIGAWRGGKPPTRQAARVTTTAQIVYNLARSMTPRGIWLWFHTPQDLLDDSTPLDRLSAGLAEKRGDWVSSVLVLARGGRAQLAD